MLIRRDIAPIVCYGALFAVVVLWAALRPANLPKKVASPIERPLE